MRKQDSVLDYDTPGELAGLTVSRARSIETLADALAESLGRVGDPFEAQLVVVSGPGTQRWLAQRLSNRLGAGLGDGICAGIDFVAMGGLRRRLADDFGLAEESQLVWRVLTLLDECRLEGWLAPVIHHLGVIGDPLRPGRRYPTARRIASLFRRYAEHRPQLLRSWEQGRTDVPSDAAWQAELWRRLRASDVVLPQLELTRQLSAGRRWASAPAALPVFAPIRVSAAELGLLRALSQSMPVSVYLLDPTPPRCSPTQAVNPLNARLGRQSARVRGAIAGVADRVVDLGRPIPEATDTVLRRLRRAVLDDAALPEPGSGPDASIQVHLGHGPDRQVEMLREILLTLLADDPTLQPRDIVVWCPDLATFAPLLRSAFGVAAETSLPHPASSLGLSVVEPRGRRDNPLLEVLDRAFSIAKGRCEASELIDLCSLEPVARRFAFDPDKGERLAELVERSRMRWGLHEQHRRQFGLTGYGQNTLSAGLDRLLLGVTLTEDDLASIGTALPFDDIDSSDVGLIGALAELITRIAHVVASFDGMHPAGTWAERAREAVELLAEPAPDESWHATALNGLLADVAEGSAAAPLGLADFQALVADRLADARPRTSYLNGSLTVCDPAALRQVPHRVVCLLGFDEQRFPRALPAEGDDLLLRDPHPDDPDPRADDRQSLLDAVLVARDALVVVGQGFDPRSNEPTPLPVPMRELLDAAAAAAGCQRESLVRIHPLQPYSRKYFEPEASGSPAGRDADPSHPPRSFDPAGLAAARLHAAARENQVSGVGASHLLLEAGENLPAVSTTEAVPLNGLIDLVAHPAKQLLRVRGELPSLRDEQVDDELPLSLDGLDQWKIGDRMLQRAVAGLPRERVEHAEWLTGDLPPRALGSRHLNRIADGVRDVLQALPAARDEAVPHPITIALANALVTGRVTTRAGAVVQYTYSKLGAKHRLAAWVQLCALVAAGSSSGPDMATPWAVVVARNTVATWHPPTPAAALDYLEFLVETYRIGLTRPLPLPLSASLLLAQAQRTSGGIRWDDAVRAAEQSWDDSWARFFPDARAILPTAPTERAELQRLACRIWDPILDSEEST